MAEPLMSISELPVPTPTPLGPGLHAARLELSGDRAWRIRLLSGERLEAAVLPGVEAELIEDCLRSGQLVIVTETNEGATILGALQTVRTLVPERDGRLSLRARSIRIEAEDGVTIQSGKSSARLESNGKLVLEGHRMLIDVNANVRVLSQLVELP